MSLFTPDANPGRPYWWEDVTWPDLTEGAPKEVDLLIIGGGYTGLSAAIAAHDAGAKVLVVDSGLPGEGASTRNGGMLGAHPRLSWSVLARRYGEMTADALFSEAGTALAWVKDLIAREGIACDLEDTGRLQLAYTKAQFDNQTTLAAQVSEKGGVPCRTLSREEIAIEISTPLYKGGMLYPNHGALHPAKFLLGLLDAALKRGIAAVGHCPVFKLARVRHQFQATTTQGLITADKVVLATNGYTGAPFPWIARRVFPVPSFLIATEPLAPETIADLARGRRMMVETRAFHSYFRISPDGSRILFGGRAALVEIGMAKAAQRLHAKMVGIWPQLQDTKISHVWMGNTGFTFGHMPHVGVREGIHYALGYSGGGTVLAPWLGRKAALQALGVAEGETAFSATTLQSRWFFKGGRPRFLQAANLWYRHVVDRRDDRESRGSLS